MLHAATLSLVFQKLHASPFYASWQAQNDKEPTLLWKVYIKTGLLKEEACLILSLLLIRTISVQL